MRTKLAREILNELRKNHKSDMFQTVINFNTKLKEAASFGQPISEYDPSSKGMRDFMALAQEIVESEQPHNLEKSVESVESQLRAISKTADELLAESQQKLGVRPVREEQRDKKISLQEKIDNFYGVRQNQGKVEFVALYPRAKSVLLAGDFNNWQPADTSLDPQGSNGRWSVDLPLAKGRHSYRYVVDGRWQEDPYNQNIQANEFGENNSVVEVK